MGETILPETAPAAEVPADLARTPEPSAIPEQPEATAALTSTATAAPSWTTPPIAPAVWVLTVLAIIASLYLARAFFVPLLIGVLVSYMLCPLVDGLERRRIPRAIAAAVVLAVLAGGVGWVGFTLRDDAQNMLDKLPETARKLRQSMSAARSAGPTPLQQVQKAASAAASRRRGRRSHQGRRHHPLGA